MVLNILLLTEASEKIDFTSLELFLPKLSQISLFFFGILNSLDFNKETKPNKT